MLPVESFTRFISNHQLLNPAGKVLAAVSGGKDSVLMAHLLKAAGYTFGIAHCNFQLRDNEATEDEQFCRQLALQLQVPFEFTRFDTQAYAQLHRISIQMAARELRYQWFEQIRQQQQYDVIALAHHQNDTVETILLNLVRGTGIAGLHGIQAVNGRLIRPMLAFTRAQIDDSIRINHLAYREDSSNASTKYARNKIRLEVVPHLQELNPNLEQTFQRSLEHFSALETLLQQQTEQAKKHVFTYSDHGEATLSIMAIKQLPSPHLLMFELLKPYGFNSATVYDLLTALDKHSGRVFESVTHRLITDRQQLLLTPKDSATIAPVHIQEHASEVPYGKHRLLITCSNAPAFTTSKHIATIDTGKLHFPLLLRSWQQGDEFSPLGMTLRKKLSDFFINLKIPLTQKACIPILVNGNGEIIWVAGYRIDNRYKVTPQTKKVTIFELQNSPHE